MSPFPAIYVEAGGGNRIVESDLIGYVEGCLRVLQFMGSIDPIVRLGTKRVMLVPGGHGNLDAALTASWGPPSGRGPTGQIVEERDPLFQIVSEDSGRQSSIPSPSRGIVMAMRRATMIREGDVAAIVAPEPVEPSTVLGEGM